MSPSTGWTFRYDWVLTSAAYGEATMASEEEVKFYIFFLDNCLTRIFCHIDLVLTDIERQVGGFLASPLVRWLSSLLPAMGELTWPTLAQVWQCPLVDLIGKSETVILISVILFTNPSGLTIDHPVLEHRVLTFHWSFIHIQLGKASKWKKPF